MCRRDTWGLGCVFSWQIGCGLVVAQIIGGGVLVLFPPPLSVGW